MPADKKNKNYAIFAGFFIFAANYFFSAQTAKPFFIHEGDNSGSGIFAEDINSGKSDNPFLKEFTVIEYPHNYDLNPHTAAYSTESQILTGLYDGLFSYDPVTLEPQFALAKDFKVSRDKKRWTFILRDGIKFSDGSAITAEDVKKSWLSLLANPDAPYSSLFDIVSGAKDFRLGKGDKDAVGISVQSPSVLYVKLNTPAPHLHKILCMSAFAVVPGRNNVYSGAFTLENRSDKEIVLKKNRNYYDAENTQLEKISFLLCGDDAENTFAFNTGAAQWLNSSVVLERLIDKDTIHLSAEFATEYLFFKMNGGIWDNAELRSALLEAVPWDELRKDVFVKASSFVYPLNGYPQVQGYAYTDDDQALFMMKEARKSAGLAENETLKITFAVNGERTKNQAELLKKAWERLGVELEIKELPSDIYLNSIQADGSDIFSYTWIGDFADPLAFLELYRSSSTLNISGWKNSEYDALLDKSAELTGTERIKILSQAEQLLLDSALIIPIQHPVSRSIIDLNAVGGWASNSFDIHPLKYIFRRETKPNLPNVVKVQAAVTAF
ncbi:MAG: peptide ABC transporter substrate-binding protein [Treponema sp.]